MRIFADDPQYHVYVLGRVWFMLISAIGFPKLGGLGGFKLRYKWLYVFLDAANCKLQFFCILSNWVGDTTQKKLKKESNI